MSNFNLKDYLKSNKLLTESLQEQTSKVEEVPYEEVKVGDKVYNAITDYSADQDLSMSEIEDEYVGTILWKGTYEELQSSKYKNLANDWDDMEDEDWSEYDLVVVDIDHDYGGYVLFNYNNDPSGVVALKNLSSNDSLEESEINELSDEGIDRMESLTHIKNLETFKKLLNILVIDWSYEGFEQDDIEEYLSQLVSKSIIKFK